MDTIHVAWNADKIRCLVNKVKKSRGFLEQISEYQLSKTEYSACGWAMFAEACFS